MIGSDAIYVLVLLVLVGLVALVLFDGRRGPSARPFDTRLSALETRMTNLEAASKTAGEDRAREIREIREDLRKISAQLDQQVTEQKLYAMGRRMLRQLRAEAREPSGPPTQITVHGAQAAGGDQFRAGDLSGRGAALGRGAQAEVKEE